MKRIAILFSFLLAGIAITAQTVQQADSLHQRGKELLGQGLTAEGRECARQAAEMRRQLLGEVNADYITSLNNYALSYSLEERYAEAKKIQQRVMELCAQLPTPHPELARFATNMAGDCYFTEDMAGAARYWEMALPLVEKFSERYEQILNGLGFAYNELGDQQSLTRIMGLMKEHNDHELGKPCDEPKCMLERAQYYAARGDEDSAKVCYQDLLAMTMDTDKEIEAYEAYAQFMAMTVRDRETGAEFQHRAAALRREAHGKDADYAHSSYMAGLYYAFAMTADGWRRAIECHEQALAVYERLGDGAHAAQCQRQLGQAYSGLRDYAAAKEKVQKALAWYAANEPTGKDYPKVLAQLASAEKFNKDFDASIGHYEQAMKLFKERDMMQEYADAENGLKLCYAYARREMPETADAELTAAAHRAQTAQLDRLIAEEKEGLEISEKYLSRMVYARSLGVIASCYQMKGEPREAVGYYNRYMQNVREAIREEFRVENEKERMVTWSEESGTVKDMQEMLVEMPDDCADLKPDVAALCYDAALLSKGILLNSSIEFEKLLNDMGDDRLKVLYAKIKANRAEIERLRRDASSDADLERILALTQESQRLQTALNKGCRELDDFTRYISYDWRAVQQALGPKDVSIEFTALHMGISDAESHMVALVLTKQMKQPVAVTLWNEEDLTALSDTPFATEVNDSIFHALFSGRDMRDVLDGQRRRLSLTDVAFKPELGLWLDYLRHKADTVKERFVADAVFMMNYRKLLQQDSVIYSQPEAGQIVWGHLSDYLQGRKRIFFSADGVLNNIGIEYLPYNGRPLSEQFEVYRLSSTKELCYRHTDGKPTHAVLFGDINYFEGATMAAATQRSLAAVRGAAGAAEFDDLGHTLREVDSIQALLKANGLTEAVRLRDTEASRAAFLGLSGSKVNILHIATHGKYEARRRMTDAESMQNSMLAFAGANDDSSALVTAADIAAMNLRQCGLAVLSACETALGKLGGDGVFGLQRGFKNAGVHTLLMSLKSVYDDSTADLMISFYRHLMEGAGKREALVKAQQDIRRNGYDDPRYWATFILLDAFEQ